MSNLFHRRAMVVPFVVLLLLVGTLPAIAATVTRASTDSITIAETGAASPYPSTIDVGGLYGGITDLNVTLSGVNHESPTDITILLAGPAGQTIVLMDDAGGESGRGASNVTLTFDDAASNFVSQEIDGALLSGTYKPTPAPVGTSNCNEIAPPASTPTGPYGTMLSDFNGTNPNGIWSLYVYDDCSFGAGSITGGWSLEISALGPFVTVPSDITVPNDPGQAGAVVNYVVTGGDHENNPITPVCSMPSGSFFPIGTTTVTCQVEDSNGRAASDSFTVTVTDIEGPVLTLPDDIVVPATGPNGATVTFSASATDNGGNLPVVCDPPSGSVFPIGTTTVTCSATDSGNLSTNGSFTVTVLGGADLLAKLRADTIDLVASSSAERALVATVDQAIQSNNPLGVYFAILKYVVQIDRYVDSRQVSPAAAQQLVSDARLALNAIM